MPVNDGLAVARPSVCLCAMFALASGSESMPWKGADHEEPHVASGAPARRAAGAALGAFWRTGPLAGSDCAFPHAVERGTAAGGYVRAAAETVADVIALAVKDAEAGGKHRCLRCNAVVSAEELARSQATFQRAFCDRCFDESFLTRRNFEMQVEIQKTVEARDGTVVQSRGEKRIAEWLTAQGLAYRYDNKFRIIGEFQIRPDFYLPELDVYIEYWGLDTPQYKMSMYKRQTLYQQEGKRLISVYPKDLSALDGLLKSKLGLFGVAFRAFTRFGRGDVQVGFQAGALVHDQARRVEGAAEHAAGMNLASFRRAGIGLELAADLERAAAQGLIEGQLRIRDDHQPLPAQLVELDLCPRVELEMARRLQSRVAADARHPDVRGDNMRRGYRRPAVDIDAAYRLECPAPGPVDMFIPGFELCLAFRADHLVEPSGHHKGVAAGVADQIMPGRQRRVANMNRLCRCRGGRT